MSILENDILILLSLVYNFAFAGNSSKIFIYLFAIKVSTITAQGIDRMKMNLFNFGDVTQKCNLICQFESFDFYPGKINKSKSLIKNIHG